MRMFIHYRLLRTKIGLVTLVCILTALGTSAQSAKPCKTKVRSNRGKSMVYGNIQIAGSEWSLGNGMQAQRIGDSIHIEKDSYRFTDFTLHGGQVVGPLYHEYYPNGQRKLTDSLTTRYGWYSKDYFGIGYGRVVYTRSYYPTGIPQSTLYYHASNGEDSLHQTWYPNGVLQKTVWAYPSGVDSATHEWSTGGVLHAVKYEGHYREYYPTGTLKTMHTDTGINNRILTYKKEYYPAGTLRSEEYEWEGIPYLTWRYYTAQGVLVKTVKHPPVPVEPFIPRVVMAEPIDGVFTFVDIQPEFPGGEPALEKFLNQHLQNIACESTLPLAGKYEVQLTVDTEGRVAYQSLKGENAAGIAESVKHQINAIPRWKPGKMQGRPITSVLVLTLVIR